MVPRKVRQLIQELKKAGFVDRGGKGSHRNFTGCAGIRVTISGKEGDDAKPYQERIVRDSIRLERNKMNRKKRADGSGTHPLPAVRLSQNRSSGARKTAVTSAVLAAHHRARRATGRTR